MAQQSGSTLFSRCLHAILRAIAFVLPIVILGMVVAVVYFSLKYGNPRPNYWFRVELLLKIIESSFLPLIGIWLLNCLTLKFAAREHAWPLVVPILLVLLIVCEGDILIRGLETLRDCEAAILMCFIPGFEAGPDHALRAMG
jgi:hypothetical protein